ncbi:VanZ family protein [Paenibacillus sp. SC116]|uniref:VanZ family protein n=1 Tax=Paenibacillus sp. SC116 TaxID=2968986 RepID=UPI0035C70F47
MFDISFTLLYIYSLPLFLLAVLLGKFVIKKSNTYLLFLSLFFFYILALLKLTLLPLPLGSLLHSLREEEQNTLLLINLKPLWLAEHYSFLLSEQLLNVLLLIPFGFLINYLCQSNTKNIMLYMVGFTLFIEFLQFMLCLYLRYPYRVIDINDVIYNFVGACMGFVFFKLFSFVYVLYIDKYNIKLDPISQFMYNAGSRHRPNRNNYVSQ